MKVVKRLWNDEAGFVVSMELILVATIAVLGLVVGMSTVRDSVTNELADVAGAVDDIVQTYAIGGIQGHSAEVFGSDYQDEDDFCDGDDDSDGSADQCVAHNIASSDEGDAAPAGGTGTGSGNNP